MCLGAWMETPIRRGDPPICREWEGKKGEMNDEKSPGIPQSATRALAPFWEGRGLPCPFQVQAPPPHLAGPIDRGSTLVHLCCTVWSPLVTCSY